MPKVALDAPAALPERGTCGLPSPVADGKVVVFLPDEMIVAIVVAVVAGEVLNPTIAINQCAETKEIPRNVWPGKTYKYKYISHQLGTRTHC